MKGWPFFQAAIAFCLLLVAGYPLRHLTAHQPPEPVAGRESRSEEEVTIALTFTQPAEKFSLKYLGKEILAGADSSAFEAAGKVRTIFPVEGIDLVFEGTWPEHFRKVGVRIEVIREDGTKQSQTLRGAREIFEVLTFSGEAEP